MLNTAVNLNLDLMGHNVMGQMIEDWCIAHHSPSPANPADAWKVRSPALISSCACSCAPRLCMHHAARSLCGVLHHLYSCGVLQDCPHDMQYYALEGLCAFLHEV